MIGHARCDFSGNKLESYLLTHFAPVWRAVNRSGWLGRKVNQVLIDRDGLACRAGCCR